VQPALRPAILLVDDDATLLSVLSRHLTREGFAVRTASGGHDALAALAKSWPALIVVDLMMPGMDGFELSQRIKRTADLPIIVLSAVDADETKVDALQHFAEDYVVKPFSPDELVARIQRVLRRATPGRAQVSIGEGELEIDLQFPLAQVSIGEGELEIDLAGRRVSTPAGSHPLTPTEVRFVQVLLGSLDRTVPTDVLLDRVWSESDGADASYVWVTVRRLRRKLEVDPDRPRYLLTERGIGYRLSSG
jgi:DNA-binding response OmpR family regulator